MTGEQSAYSKAERVFRTEINRAHNDAYERAAFEHPETVGTKFVLSPRHPKRDICDLHAGANLYGLGAGVYPKGRSPYPAHPNTFSYQVVVFADEVTRRDRNGKQKRIDWLKQQPRGDQINILGPNKANLLARGLLKDNAINTPWRTLKKRLEKLGIDPQKAISGRLVPGTSPGAVVAKSVSDALEVKDHKRVSARVLAAIDSVHRDGILPKIPIGRDYSRKHNGVYYHWPHNDKASDMKISTYATDKELTLAHEIGHFLDHKGLPEASFSSTNHAIMKEWRQAVHATPEYKKINEWLKDPYIGEGRYRQNVGEHLTYLKSTHELFARAYAQYIANKSGDAILKKQLADRIAKQRFPSQWSPENFEPVSREMDKLFDKMGWLNK